MPITPDRVGCYDRHGAFAPNKYHEMFSSVSFLAMLDSASLRELSGGVDFRGTANHWHFMVDGLGTLNGAVLRPGCVLYVDVELSDDQLGFLRLHAGRHVAGGLNRIEKINDDVVRVSDFRFCANRPLRLKVLAARNTLGITRRPSRSDDAKLFVLRENASTRRLLNQDALAKLLEKEFGFTSVDPGAMSLDRQKELFSNARIIIGPHGAGLANAIFSECPQLLFEIYHSIQQPFFRVMCDGLGARHMYIEGLPEKIGMGPVRSDDADYTVDEESVLRVLRDVSTQYDLQ